MKSGATAMIMALDSVIKAGVKLKGDVIIESVLDEEQGGASTVACCMKGYKADAAIIVEPTDCMIIAASQGFYYLNVKVKGKSAQAGRRWEGVSAIEKAFKVCQAIEDLQNYREQNVSHPAYDRKQHPYFVPLVVGAMEAGVEHGGVPGEALLKCRLGFLANEEPEAVLKQFKETMKKVADSDPWMKDHPPEIEQAMFVKAGGIDVHHPIIQTLKTSYKRVTKTEPAVTGKTSGNEQRLLVHAANTPTILFGVMGGEAHSPNEYLGPIESLFIVTKTLALTILGWCGVQE
jgi:acetylornithine deacetylase